MLNPLLQCVCASASSEGQKLFGTTSETTSERRPDARTTPQPCAAPQGSAWPPFQEKGTWRIIPGSKWLVTSIYKLSRPLTRGIASFRELTNHGQESAPSSHASSEGQKLFGTTSETMSDRRPDAGTAPTTMHSTQGSAWAPFRPS